MKVSELAKELNISTKVVLEKLKSLKLKAKDGSQELNRAVLVVLRSEIKKEVKAGKILPVGETKAEPSKAGKKESKKTKKSPATKAEKTKIVKDVSKAKKGKPAAAKKELKAKAQPQKGKKTSEKPKKVKARPGAEPFIPLKPLLKKKKKQAPTSVEEPAGPSKDKLSMEGLATGTGEPEGRSGTSVPHQADTVATPVVDVTDLKPLELKIPISVKDFAVAIQEKTGVVLKKLMDMGIFANINQTLGEKIVKDLARKFGCNVTEVKTQEQQLIDAHIAEEEDTGLSTPRAPVVTLMGHVDHGKTSLLDQVRKSRIVDSEHGGITQHIGAYSVKTPKGMISFLDTPGHEAFTAMRARGAHITDLVVLVIAADEGIMPQTVEAIDHARAADVPIVVALNKIDRKNADPDRVKKQLSDMDLKPEDWGGGTIVVGVSALTGEGVDTLLEMILLEAEMLELKANKDKKASGIVVEAHLSQGKGSVASLIVQSGTLKNNDIIVVGPYYGKIRAMFDCYGKRIDTAGPSMPVEVLGLMGVPEAGSNFYVVDDEKQAREITLLRREQAKDEKFRSAKRITLEDLYARIQEGSIKELNVILKADVQGSVEALKDSLQKIPSDEVKVKFIHMGVGDVNASDVILAVASNAIIIAFHVGVGPKASEELEKTPVDVREYRIIYDAVNDVKKSLEGLLEPKVKRRFLSRLEVRQVFKLSKSGMVAGCFVLKGKITRKANVDVVRNGQVVHSGTITSLKRFKDDVRDVNEGYECGLTVSGFDKLEAGDIVEAFEVEKIARTI